MGSRRVPDARRELRFNNIDYDNFSVVVLNLQAPSVLLGFQVGGIVGHKFLSPYRVSIDIDRSQLRMSTSTDDRHSPSGHSELRIANRDVVRAARQASRRAWASRHRSSSSGLSTRSGGTGCGLPSRSMETKVKNARLVSRRTPLWISSENTSTCTSSDVRNVR